MPSNWRTNPRVRRRMIVRALIIAYVLVGATIFGTNLIWGAPLWLASAEFVVSIVGGVPLALLMIKLLQKHL